MLDTYVTEKKKKNWLDLARHCNHLAFLQHHRSSSGHARVQLLVAELLALERTLDGNGGTCN